MLRWVLGIVAFVAVLGAAAFFTIMPARIDAHYNAIVPHKPVVVSPEGAALHASLNLADLHADTLLWMRNPMVRQTRGHVDAPRLEAGGYRLQVFSAVTKAPKNLNFERNTGDTDNITPLAIAQRWPVRTWSSLLERALYQASLQSVRTRSELEAAMAGGRIAAVLATEGAHPLEGRLENVRVLYEAGYRMMGLQHFFDNELGGSLHGVSGGGLTEFGRQAVAEALRLGMMIDVAHSSEAVVRDVLALTDAPIVVSHTGVYGHCQSRRNIPDALMKEIADRGGLIGIGFWDGAVCENKVDAIADAIVYAVGLLGAGRVALGSDFDGTVTTPIDASEAAALTDALLSRGLEEDVIRAVMGENQIRFFLENLPEARRTVTSTCWRRCQKDSIFWRARGTAWISFTFSRSRARCWKKLRRA